ncbi:metallophosphoesterase [Anaeroselena agilis]|uniref:Metallophosphoesterase n=1 Tax=Anaeroselena agilis TaxID=3063788 RepID=A0ABU3P0Z0_9FIRM|nr:metallophosphoesterase [Selenomonadales bacterium 4137-cl]
MRFVVAIFSLLALTVFLSWLNYRLLARLFIFWRGRFVRRAYLLLTAAAALVMVFGWPRRPWTAEPGQELLIFLIYGALVWLCGQLVLIVLQPLFYAVDRWDRRRARGKETAPAEPGMSRRAFISGALAAVPLVAFVPGAKGVYSAQAELAVVRHSVVVSGLPAGLDGFRIGQVSDTHVGPYFDLTRLETVCARLRAEKPDLMVMTGDFVDDLSQIAPAVERLAALQADVPHGVYFCWGNHEYFRDPRLVEATLRAGGIKILKNASAEIVPGERPLYLLGVDYPPAESARRSLNIPDERRQECFAAANRGVPAGAVRVLIAHHPDFLIDGFAGQVPLTLAGHSHGGQVVIGGRPLVSLHRYVRGLYRQDDLWGYVSSGAGHWFPFRLGCPPEISVFTLRA